MHDSVCIKYFDETHFFQRLLSVFLLPFKAPLRPPLPSQSLQRPQRAILPTLGITDQYFKVELVPCIHPTWYLHQTI